MVDPLTGRGLSDPLVAVRLGVAASIGIWVGYVVSVLAGLMLGLEQRPAGTWLWTELWRNGPSQAIPTASALTVFVLRNPPTRHLALRLFEGVVLSFVAWTALQFWALQEELLTDPIDALQFAKSSLAVELPIILGVGVSLPLTARFAGQLTAGMALALPYGVGCAPVVFDAGVGPEMLMAYMVAAALSVPVAERLLVRLSPPAPPVPPQATEAGVTPECSSR